MRVLISAGSVDLEAMLKDTPTAHAIYDCLPLEAYFNIWGDEFYFEIPVSMGLDLTATTEVRVGDMGYWPPGRALAIFFGRTPMSTGDDPVPAGEVNIVGRIEGDAILLKGAASAGRIRIEKL